MSGVVSISFFLVKSIFLGESNVTNTDKPNASKRVKVCKPNIVVSYIREYFAKDDVRITYDKNISYNLFKKNFKKIDQNIIVELKTSINKNLNDLIKEFPFQEIRFSKYCNGIEILK